MDGSPRSASAPGRASNRTRTSPGLRCVFSGAALFPDLELSHFYVYYRGEQQLFHYAFEAEAGSFLPIEDRFPLADCVGAPALTRDGAFLCTTADGIERRAPLRRATRFKLPAGVSTAIRLLPRQAVRRSVLGVARR